jgi:hypothetical protein
MIWFASPYVFYIVSMLVVELHKDVDVAPIFYWKNQIFLLMFCAVPSVFGAAILWRLPISRVLLGIITGILLAGGGVALCTWLVVVLFGDFNANAGFLVTALTVLLPCSSAGAYAGLLRSRDATDLKRGMIHTDSDGAPIL